MPPAITVRSGGRAKNRPRIVNVVVAPGRIRNSLEEENIMFPKEMNDPNLRRVIWSSLIGATIEWYDFFLYGVVAGIVFNKLYFPNSDPLVSTLLAYTTFAVGFVARPLGGVRFCLFGDWIGRNSVCGVLHLGQCCVHLT